MRLSRRNLPCRHAAMMAMARRLTWAVFHDHQPMTMEEMMLRAVAMGGGGLFLSLRLFLTALAHAGRELAVRFDAGDQTSIRLYRADPISGRLLRQVSSIPTTACLTIDCAAEEWETPRLHLEAWEISHLLRVLAAQAPLSRRQQMILCQAGPTIHRHSDYPLPPLSLAASGIPLLHLTETDMDLATEYGYYHRLATTLHKADFACNLYAYSVQ